MHFLDGKSPVTRSAKAWLFFMVCQLGFLAILLYSQDLEAARGGKTEALPVQKAVPPAVVIETVGQEQDLRKLIRTQNAVGELPNSPVRFSEAPIGSYGFIEPKYLGMALATQSPDLVLERAPTSPNAYEIHKVADGNGMVIGFLGKEVAQQIKPKERLKSVRIALHSNPSDAAPLIAAVPLTKLVADQMPRPIDRNKRDGRVLLEMDLQGTANRKAPGE